MQKRRLPGTDLELSALGMGCWAIGGLWWGDDVRDDDSRAAIGAALDAGINWFDTAPLYGHGHADKVLMQALGARRHEVVIATKVGVRFGSDGDHAHSDLSAAWIAADIDASLKRLGLETIDLLQVHWPCQAGTPLAETMEALQRAVTAGKVRHVGLCNYNAAGLAEASRHGSVASLQTPYSMLRREFEGEVRGAAQGGAREDGRAIGVLAYEPLCRGLLTGRFRADHRFPDSDQRARDDRFQGRRFMSNLAIASRLKLLARRHDLPASALAIAWVCRQPAITAAIAGAKRPEQVLQNARAAEVLDQDELLARINRLVP